jgi:hypothetical protein
MKSHFHSSFFSLKRRASRNNKEKKTKSKRVNEEESGHGRKEEEGEKEKRKERHKKKWQIEAMARYEKGKQGVRVCVSERF